MSAPVGPEELHAYVDGRLDAPRRAAVEAHLAAHPDAAARVEEWRRQAAGMRRLFDPVLDEPVPPRLLRRPGRRSEAPAFRPALLRQAAAVLWLCIGMALGWVAHERLVPAPAAAPVVARAAIGAHLVYAAEVRHPVEVGADQSDHLFTWLSNRLGGPVRAPSLEAAGWTLVGGRLLPSDSGPAGQFMYQNGAGERLTLYVARTAGGQETAFRSMRAQGVGAVWWLDRGFAFALAGQADHQALQRAAHLAYQGLAG